MATVSTPAGPGLRETLIRATEQEIAENGIGAVSMRAIARRVGVSHQAPGHHFRDRKGLLTALAIDGFDRLRAHIQTAHRNTPVGASISERMSASGIGYITFADQHPAVFDLMMRPELHDVEDPDLVRARTECFSVLLNAVEEARQEGWGSDRSQEELAMTCWSLAHGAVTLWRDGDLSLLFPGTTIEDVAHNVTSVLSTALAPPD